MLSCDSFPRWPTPLSTRLLDPRPFSELPYAAMSDTASITMYAAFLGAPHPYDTAYQPSK